MFLKRKPIFVFLASVISITIILAIFCFYGFPRDIILSVGAILLAPVIAIFVGEQLRKRTEKEREEYETLRALVSFRHTTGSPEFLGALNRVVLVFDKNSEIKKLVKELWNGYVNGENPVVSKRRQIELIYAICKHMGRNVTEFEIDSFFVPAIRHTPVPIRQSPPSSSDPASTANNISDTASIAVNSWTKHSITGNSFLGF